MASVAEAGSKLLEQAAAEPKGEIAVRLYLSVIGGALLDIATSLRKISDKYQSGPPFIHEMK